MRIISGRLKGRTILVPKNFLGRPTTDFAREGLFNVLSNLVDFQGRSVLDLFAGTGAFGLECCSRGATKLTSIDLQPLHAKFISDNFRHFEITNATARKQDVFKYIDQASEQFDIIFADPPYDLESLDRIPELILSRDMLKPGGIFILEHGKGHNFSGHVKFLQERKYSNVHFSFFGDAE